MKTLLPVPDFIGIAIHVNRKLLFVSESTGNIIRMPLKKENFSYSETLLILASNSNCIPMELSMDWLNDQLYILCEVHVQQRKVWQIVRCSLYGQGYMVAIGGLTTKPHCIEIDPYNGYV